MPKSVPNDVVSEILSWAPVKSACRFRCASTGWRALISDPAFVAAHKARTEPQLLIVANSFHGVASGGRRRRRDLRLLDADGGVVREVKSVGDLWTIISGPRGPVCATRVGRVLNVIDLATGDVLLTSTEMDDGGASCTFGIGYAAPWDEGKVVRLTSLYYMGYAARPPEHTCDVLTLEIGAGTWRRRRSPPIIDRVCFHKNSVVTIDGVLYFLYSLAPPQVGYRVLRLDLETEEWKRSIKAPVRLQEVRSEVRMVELDGTLCMVHSEERGTKHACTTIWLLSDLAEGTWVEAYMIPMAPTIDLVIPFRVMHHGGKLMCYCLRNDRPSPTLQVYDPLNGTCTHLADLPDNHVGDVGFCDLHLECYIRST